MIKLACLFSFLTCLTLSKEGYSQDSTSAIGYKKNQIEFGFNMCLIGDKIYSDEYESIIKNPVSYFHDAPLAFIGHLGPCYKRFIKANQFVMVDFLQFISGVNGVNNGYVGLIGFSSRSFSVGYGYAIVIKKFQLSAFGSIPYRYWGGETLLIGYYDNFPGGYKAPEIYWTSYNSIGIGCGMDINYYFTPNKKLGLGTKLQYNYFPFDNQKIENPQVYSHPQYLTSYKQINKLVLLQIKTSYRF